MLQPAAWYFNPRSPHGERPAMGNRNGQSADISIHAPRTGSDRCNRRTMCVRRRFQSTLPARGATRCQNIHLFRVEISIHAPRTGSDKLLDLFGLVGTISIHAPRTGSDGIVTSMITWIIPFQSTLPARGATKPANLHAGRADISIHAPRTGSDQNI